MIKKHHQSGFTLVELLVVIAIIGILTAIGVPMYTGYQTSAKVSATKQNYDSMKTFIAGELTKCSAGLVPSLNDPKASPSVVNCPADLATLSTPATYFVAYTGKTMKNPYNSTDLTPTQSGAASASTTSAGRLFINAADTNCPQGLTVQTVVQDTASATTSYIVYPAASECINAQ